MIPDEAIEDATVPMKYMARVNVLPEYVRAYLDEGWTIDDSADGV